uniref:Probable 6-phosphogluconolactonase 4, chloroplastic n=1 Tax=Nicotiana sylvestris TaxID=4096 RepID=A0A1U7VR09_NICSY|nr:PREDICTED: probable 6-phosphogluconolactonase 4, chloroplastic [Nicotiana sylvestris]
MIRSKRVLDLQRGWSDGLGVLIGWPLVTDRRRGQFPAGGQWRNEIPIPSDNVYAINDALSVEGAADNYETCLRYLVKTKIVDISDATGFPKFDVMLLGMGPDGHVASLFHGHPLVHEKEKWVTFIRESPKPPLERITFTFPLINSSANIALIVAGVGKADVVHKSLGDSESCVQLVITF